MTAVDSKKISWVVGNFCAAYLGLRKIQKNESMSWVCKKTKIWFWKDVCHPDLLDIFLFTGASENNSHLIIGNQFFLFRHLVFFLTYTHLPGLLPSHTDIFEFTFEFIIETSMMLKNIFIVIVK